MPAEIDPDLALDLAKATADAYARATEQLIAIVARQTRVGTYDPDGWAVRKLAELQQLQAESRKVVDRLAVDTPGLVNTAIRTAYDAGHGLPIGTHTRAVDQLVNETVTKLQSVHGQILRSVIDDYRDVIARTSTMVTTGSMTIDQARRAALDQFAAKGITGFTDSAGRQWRLDRYAEMATRTAVGRAQVAGTLDEIRSHGGDLVIVSHHSGTCPVCAPWEAKVLAITGSGRGTTEDGNGHKADIAGTVADAQAAGLQHPNCRHALTRFVPGLTVPPKPGRAPTDGQERRRARNDTQERQRLAGRRRAARTGTAAAARRTTRV